MSARARALVAVRISKSSNPERKHIPWKRNRPTMLDARPNEPTMTTRRGFDISVAKVNHGAWLR